MATTAPSTLDFDSQLSIIAAFESDKTFVIAVQPPSTGADTKRSVIRTTLVPYDAAKRVQQIGLFAADELKSESFNLYVWDGSKTDMETSCTLTFPDNEEAFIISSLEIPTESLDVERLKELAETRSSSSQYYHPVPNA